MVQASCKTPGEYGPRTLLAVMAALRYADLTMPSLICVMSGDGSAVTIAKLSIGASPQAATASPFGVQVF